MRYLSTHKSNYFIIGFSSQLHVNKISENRSECYVRLDDQNICSVRQERGCSEMEKLEGELFFPRENFPFPRSDSCLAERSEGRQSRSRKRKALEEKKGA